MKLLWPRHFNRLFLCPLCSQSLTDDLPICRYCYVDLPRLQLYQYHYNLLNHARYQRVLEHKYYDSLVCAAQYKWPANHLVTELKFSGQTKLADFMAKILSKQLSRLQCLPDAIVPVPIHSTRLRERGYNQAELIARYLARQFQLPLMTTLICKAHSSAPQSELTGKMRRKNLRHSFSLNNSESMCVPQHIAIVDDVITTGSTTNEVARILKSAGVRTVDVWGFALTEP